MTSNAGSLAHGAHPPSQTRCAGLVPRSRLASTTPPTPSTMPITRHAHAPPLFASPAGFRQSFAARKLANLGMDGMLDLSWSKFGVEQQQPANACPGMKCRRPFLGRSVLGGRLIRALKKIWSDAQFLTQGSDQAASASGSAICREAVNQGHVASSCREAVNQAGCICT